MKNHTNNKNHKEKMKTKTTQGERLDRTASFKRFGVQRKTAMAVIAVTLAGLGGTCLANPSNRLLETSPAYEDAAVGLRSGTARTYEFNRASLRDVLRFLADDADVSFIALPEEGQNTAKLVTFSLKASPFSALEIVARNNGIALVYEEGIWHMRPLDDKQLIARTYNIRYNTTELNNTSGGSSSSSGGIGGGGGSSSSGSSGIGGGGGGSFGGGSSGGGGGGGIGLGLQGTQNVFENTADELIESIEGLIGIATTGYNANRAANASVGNFPPLRVNAGGTIPAATSGGPGTSASAASGQVLWNSDNNGLYVVATRQQHQWVEGYIDMFDKPQPLIAVEVKFFETTKDPSRQLGVDWSGVMDGGYDFSLSGLQLSDINLDRIGDTIAPQTAILNANDMNISISALLKDRETTTVSYPRVLTRNNREVSIQSVVNQPVLAATSTSSVTTGGVSASSVSYLPIGTSINVLPKRMADGRIQLQVLITISSIIGSEIIDGNSYPVATTRQFSAPLEVESGWTLAIGGLDEANESVGGSGLPLLSRIPIGRHIFGNTTQSQTRKNLMIFITPTLLDVRSGGLTEEPISTIPLRGGTEMVVEVPRIRPDGTLVGGVEGVGNAIKWMEQEYRPLEQRVVEHRNNKSDRDLINRLINTVNVLNGQVNDMASESPEDASILEVHEWSLDNLEKRMRKSRRSIFKSKLSRYNHNSVLDE
ncbi:MAG: hypothetical protein ACI9UA_000732 [Pseudoalteromonas tetraodonis]